MLGRVLVVSGREVAARAAAGAPLDVRTYRDALGQFATGIAVVTTSHEGVLHAMTVNSFTSVSLDPLLVLVCVERRARFYDAIVDAGQWVVSVLGAKAQAAAAWFATRGRPLAGQLTGYDWHPGAVTGLPVLDMAISSLEVVTTAVHPGGDHVVVVGEVVGVDPGDETSTPLLYHRGRYRHLAP